LVRLDEKLTPAFILSLRARNNFHISSASLSKIMGCYPRIARALSEKSVRSTTNCVYFTLLAAITQLSKSRRQLKSLKKLKDIDNMYVDDIISEIDQLEDEFNLF
jgi:hypothetical protein